MGMVLAFSLCPLIPKRQSCLFDPAPNQSSLPLISMAGLSIVSSGCCKPVWRLQQPALTSLQCHLIAARYRDAWYSRRWCTARVGAPAVARMPPPPPLAQDGATTDGLYASSINSDAGDMCALVDPTDVSTSSSGMALLLRAVKQVLLLAVALAGLILLPAQLSGGLLGQRAWRAAASYCLYLLFFTSGTLTRMLRHGRLAPPKQDAQRAGGNRVALLLFAAVAVPAGHYGAWFDGSFVAASPGIRGVAHQVLPPLGYALMLAGCALNTAAATALGKDFNRLVVPDRLVTGGCYAWVRHPLYTSYMMLFVGNCLSLSSPAAAAFLWTACLSYYCFRIRIEEQLLSQVFGDEYQRYRSQTGRFVPRLVWWTRHQATD